VQPGGQRFAATGDHEWRSALALFVRLMEGNAHMAFIWDMCRGMKVVLSVRLRRRFRSLISLLIACYAAVGFDLADAGHHACIGPLHQPLRNVHEDALVQVPIEGMWLPQCPPQQVDGHLAVCEYQASIMNL
jgi:hypothetical protein